MPIRWADMKGQPHHVQPCSCAKCQKAQASSMAAGVTRAKDAAIARAGDQPLPVKNTLPNCQDMLITDVEARKTLGLKRYGTLLQPHNGRDFLRDAYEEAMDLAIYLRGILYERDGK